jgi:zinc/manganese transport system ATP-binding protein
MASEVLVLEGVSKSLAGRVLFSHLDLAVKQGEFIAILGPNGAGKTTLLRIVAGLASPDTGLVKRITPQGSRPFLGYVPQARPFPRYLPIRVAELFDLNRSNGLVGKLRHVEPYRQVLTRLGWQDIADKLIHQLSGGEQQKARIALALARRPWLLVCDEPLAALDPAQQSEIVWALDRYRRDNDVAVLFVTHDIEVVADMADRVLYLANGQHAVGTVHEVIQPAVLSRIYGRSIAVVELEGRRIAVGAGHPGPPDAYIHHQEQA